MSERISLKAAAVQLACAMLHNRHPKSVQTVQQLNTLYWVTSGVPDRLTKLQNLIGMGVRCWSYSFKNCFIFRNICSKRTGNQLLDNMAASHDHPVLEKKRKAEVVMAASTKKSASALAHRGNSGGVSFHSDNVGTVNIS